MIAVGPLVALDRIVGVEPGRRATALRNVPNTLAIFDSHFPLRPVLPGVLVLASMAELARILLVGEADGTDRAAARAWQIARADRIRYRHFIEPGDQMEIEVEVKDLGEQRATFKAAVRVDGKLVTSASTLTMAKAVTYGGAIPPNPLATKGGLS
jgi:3-hydroxyacyl-[acyl-carrier-protein] dehydratase